MAFIAAFLLVTVVINLVVIVGLMGHPGRVLQEHPEYVAWTSLIVLGTMLIATWHRSSQLRAGGIAVARSLGGVPVLPKDEDPKRKRLLNIVEEMAIAARIRKPAVYVLPDEPCINAFAAGFSPDEAAVAVTQGALDKLDRDQLQAVIGHEFSHILNGDMRINMRLIAWIFGLFVITDLASRIMNRSRRRQECGAPQAGGFRHIRRRQCRAHRRASAAGRGVTASRTPRRCVRGAVHAQSAGIAGRVHRHGCNPRRFATCNTPARSTSHTCSSAAPRPRGPRSSAPAGSRPIPRSRSACMRSTHASRR